MTGLLYSEASEDTDLLGDFTLEIVQEKESDQPAGTIISQDPTANSTVTANTGTVIQVVLSTGKANEVLMPNMLDKDYRDANSDLNTLAKKNNLTLKIDFTSKTEYNDEIEKDHVISTIPAEGEALTDGTTVYLVVSLGKDTQPVDMPGLLGKTEDMARKMLDSVGLGAGLGTALFLGGDTGLLAAQCGLAGLLLSAFRYDAVDAPEPRAKKLRVTLRWE